MSRAKIQVIDTDNIGIYADFGSESEDEHKMPSYAYTRWWGRRNILEESNW